MHSAAVKSPQPCAHLTADHSVHLDFQQLKNKLFCSTCKYSGSNLWICLNIKCLQIGCSEQICDHSTVHFESSEEKSVHCIHLNLSSKRAWCYLCEREISLDGFNVLPNVCNDTITNSMRCASDDDDNDVETSEMGTGLVGLQNIANTCYMNSALQALSNILPMTYYFLNCSDLVDHNLEHGSARCKVGLAKSYQRLMSDMWRKRNDHKGYIAPRSILYGIRNVHPMFRGFQQHDTQEFLRCFMDQLHEELKEQYNTTLQYPNNLSSTAPASNKPKTDNDDDTPSEMSSCSSTETTETDFITCESSPSEAVSLNDAPFVSTPNAVQIQSNTTITNPSATVLRSIVSDIFDGKLLSSVQCLTCDRISAREETFQDLSLPIPNRDFLTVLHHANSISLQSLNSIDSSTLVRSNDSWLWWLWNLVRSWLWGPSVNLYDCMAAFFSADELKGDNMYSCEKCNKLRTGIKYSKVLELPEVLCIHLKRFRHDLSYSTKISSHVEFPLVGFDMRPYLHKDCKSEVPFYNLTSVICHHGTVGGGHYTCYARNSFTDRWYEYDDHNVNEVSADLVKNCQAYVLFYHKYNPQMEIMRFEANELASSYRAPDADIRFYISREWLVRFNSFSEPGPINNWAILCPHGGLLQSKTTLHLAVPISQQLWDYLQSKFGGGPVINMLFECESCKRCAEQLARRQFFEHTIFSRYSGLDAELQESGAIYAVSMTWLRKWQQFARGLTHKEPGPINNSNIVSNQSETTIAAKCSPIRNVRIGSDYAQLNAPLWRFLSGIYGGGPEVLLRPSLSEEIEIIDQDEVSSISEQNANISDTESNIDHNAYTTKEVDHQKGKGEAITTSSEQISINVPAALGTLVINEVDNKRVENRRQSTKSRTLSNNIRKKAKKSRSDLHYAELLGTKGSYNILKLEDDLNHSSEANDTTLVNDNAFEGGTSFQIVQNHINDIAGNIPLVEKEQTDSTAIVNSKPLPTIHHLEKHYRSKNAVVLKKYIQLRPSNRDVDNETEI